MAKGPGIVISQRGDPCSKCAGVYYGSNGLCKTCHTGSFGHTEESRRLIKIRRDIEERIERRIDREADIYE